jgi:hypothetical protein
MSVCLNLYVNNRNINNCADTLINKRIMSIINTRVRKYEISSDLFPMLINRDKRLRKFPSAKCN